MRFKTLAVALAVTLVLGVSAQAKELRFAFQGDANSMDPYNLNETFTLGFLGNIYEALTRRTADLTIEPALATSWEVIEPTRWRFHLRRGVKFHDGRDFTADDVLFSFERVKSETSDLKTRVKTVKEVIKIDDYTVDFVTTVPDPILIAEWDTWYIMSKGWAEENGAVTPQSATGDDENFATRNANGTGPFRLVSREADVRTVAEVNPDWWDNANKEHNLTKITFTPIGSDPTRVAALLSGQVDMAYPVPVQDMKRVDSNAETSVLVGPELRTIFIGMDQFRDELLYSDVKGKNPFKDVRVRKALYQAIDIEAIKEKVMRGLSTPSAMMIGAGVHGFDPAIERFPFDPEASKALLAEAGYPNGFRVGLDCPNDRYVNDEAICQAVVSMMAKVGVTLDLNAQTKGLFFGKVLRPSLDYSMYLLGWTPGSFDSHNVIYGLHGCPDDSGKGQFNLGGYCNVEVDALADKILSETDVKVRDGMITEAWAKTIAEVSYLPLHQQALAWGVRSNVSVKQRADNQFAWRHVVIQ